MTGVRTTTTGPQPADERLNPGTVDADVTEAPPLLHVAGVHKRFGGVRALDGADLTLAAPGTVHGLIGENGSGKSTLLGVLSGQLRPDAGTVHIDGRPRTFHDPSSAIAAGIVMVSQEIAVAPDLTVAENILLGRRLVRRGAGISWKATRERAVAVLERLDLDYDPEATVRSLRPDQRQMIEIARALSLQSRVVILDEPTSSLSDDEVGALFSAVRRLKENSVTTLFVSHRMAELFEICDELTVIRDGKTQGAGRADAFTRDSLVDLMVGPARSALHGVDDPRTRRPPVQPDAAVVLQVTDLSVDGAVRGVSFDVRAGEIVGIAGLVGAGRSELLEAIFGARPRSAGTTTVHGSDACGSSPRGSIGKGVGYLSPDRKQQGLVLSMDVRDNALMVATHSHPRWRRPRPERHGPGLREAARSLNLAYSADPRPVTTLSGGNQQKVALAKWLMASPRVLLLDEPTRGVDVCAKGDIHKLLHAIAANGTALLVSSSENDELLALCSRIIVMSRGSVVAIVDAADVDEAQLANLAGGHS